MLELSFGRIGIWSLLSRVVRTARVALGLLFLWVSSLETVLLVQVHAVWCSRGSAVWISTQQQTSKKSHLVQQVQLERPHHDPTGRTEHRARCDQTGSTFMAANEKPL